ncbi:MAG: hypothetical protein DCC65_11555 [Planctomycetota bacterium]|nr:MAG: hypothetical protein DCC65_11555 [Planctomycetota bacterium]
MPIAVACKCGKKFKVKDELAGKAVRCPACKSPLRIPGGAPAAAGVRGGGKSAPSVDAQAAMLKFEEAQKKKQLSAEEEAKYREEQKKLIESYDQLAGKSATTTKDGKKIERPTEALPKKPTIFTKIADLFGAIFGTFIAKYVIIAVLAAGGVLGSIYLVQYIGTYVHSEGSAKMPNKDRARLLLKEAEEDISAKRWTEARQKLLEAGRLDSALKIRREYRDALDKVNKALPSDGGK